MNALSTQQQQRINHVWHNVTQNDPAMRLQGLRYYAPQMNAVEKAVLYNAMRPNWAALSNEERRIYARMAQDADAALNGRVGDAFDNINALLEQTGLGEQIKQAQEAWKNPKGTILISVDVSGLAALGFTGLEKTAPDKALGLDTTVHFANDSQKSAWSQAADAATRLKIPMGITHVGNTRMNAADFMAFRKAQHEIERTLSFLFTMFGGTGTIRVKIDAEASLYDKVANIHIPNLVDSVKESAKELLNKGKDAGWSLGKWAAVIGGVGFVGWVTVTLLAARLRSSSIHVQVAGGGR